MLDVDGDARSDVGPSKVFETETRTDGAAAIRRAFDTHYGRLVGLASLLLDDRVDAEEVVQEAFAQTWRRWDAVRDHGDPIGYLRQSVINESRGRLRRVRSARRAGWRAQPPAAVMVDPAGAVESDETRAAVLAALRRLPARQRECIVLRFYGDCSVAAVAEALGISEGAVKAHCHRALATLARLLEEAR
jgi:RNA polymerase sigma-70 factor (sigma-E family)